MTVHATTEATTAVGHPDDVFVGTTLASWTVKARIASSAHATVFRVERDGCVGAFKLYRTTVDPFAIERGRREAMALSRVSHRAIAPLLEAGTVLDDAPYVVTSWIDGTLLSDRLAGGPMPWAELHPILIAICDGLIAVHGAGVVHRDLKPTNLIIPRGENPAAIILDLGHALIAGDDRITQSGLAIGSVSFMAPEQAVGHRADPRSDLYAVGAILYRALTGHPVFVGTTAEVLQAHATTAIVAPRSRAPELAIPREAEDLCLWLLAKNPAERVPSATVLAVTLSVVSRSR